jgi:hypothetical protein
MAPSRTADSHSTPRQQHFVIEGAKLHRTLLKLTTPQGGNPFGFDTWIHLWYFKALLGNLLEVGAPRSLTAAKDVNLLL